MTGPSSPYTVGYGKPPLATRFAKGTSGNPSGRPRQTRSTELRTLLVDVLGEKVAVREGGRVRKITRAEALMRTVVNEALKGKPDAWRSLLQILKSGPDAGSSLSGVLPLPAGLSLEQWLAQYGPPGGDP